MRCTFSRYGCLAHSCWRIRSGCMPLRLLPHLLTPLLKSVLRTRYFIESTSTRLLPSSRALGVNTLCAPAACFRRRQSTDRPIHCDRIPQPRCRREIRVVTRVSRHRATPPACGAITHLSRGRRATIRLIRQHAEPPALYKQPAPRLTRLNLRQSSPRVAAWQQD